MIELNELRLVLIQELKNFRYQEKQLPNYQQLCRFLMVKPPNSIAKLTSALEQLMLEDHLAQQPQLAAVCVQKRKPVPREGFFQYLSELGLYSGPDKGNQAEIWHIRELDKLCEFYAHLLEKPI